MHVDFLKGKTPRLGRYRTWAAPNPQEVFTMLNAAMSRQLPRSLHPRIPPDEPLMMCNRAISRMDKFTTLLRLGMRCAAYVLRGFDISWVPSRGSSASLGFRRRPGRQTTRPHGPAYPQSSITFAFLAGEESPSSLALEASSHQLMERWRLVGFSRLPWGGRPRSQYATGSHWPLRSCDVAVIRWPSGR